MKKPLKIDSDITFFIITIPLFIFLFYLFHDNVLVAQLPVYFIAGLGFSKFFSPYLSWGVFAIFILIGYCYIVATLRGIVAIPNLGGSTEYIGIAGGLCALILCGIAKLTVNACRRIRRKKYAKELSYLSDNQIFFDDQQMKESKLSEDEIKFFKADVNKRYHNYLYLRSVAGKMAQIVPNYERSIELIQGIFREMAATPRLMLEMDDFLYKHLDEYTRIARSVMNLQDNLIKEEGDDQLVAAAGKKLVAMEKDFAADYKKVTDNEREALRNL